jgi:hypothetical protein
VAEVGEISCRASGRNRGKVIPGIEYGADELIAKFPPKSANARSHCSPAADVVIDLVERRAAKLRSRMGCSANRA